MNEKQTPDQLDAIYDLHSEEDGFERALVDYKIAAVGEHISGGSVLDVGCGVGILTAAIAAFADQVTGLDGSAAKIDRARSINSRANVDYVNAMFEEWSFANRFDTIVATNVLEHVPSPTEFLDRCVSLLNPAGRIIITVPNARSLHKLIGQQLGVIDELFTLTADDISKGHLRIYDAESLRSEIEQADFEITRVSGILLKPLSNRQMNAWDRKLVDAYYAVGRNMPNLCSSLLVVGKKS